MIFFAGFLFAIMHTKLILVHIVLVWHSLVSMYGCGNDSSSSHDVSHNDAAAVTGAANNGDGLRLKKPLMPFTGNQKQKDKDEVQEELTSAADDTEETSDGEETSSSDEDRRSDRREGGKRPSFGKTEKLVDETKKRSHMSSPVRVVASPEPTIRGQIGLPPSGLPRSSTVPLGEQTGNVRPRTSTVPLGEQPGNVLPGIPSATPRGSQAGTPPHITSVPPTVPSRRATPPPRVASPELPPPPPPPPPANALPLEIPPPVSIARCNGQFYERYCVEGEGNIPQYIIGAAPVSDEERGRIVSNAVGEWVVAKITNNPPVMAPQEFQDVLVPSVIAARANAVDYKRFWISSKGQDFANHINGLRIDNREGRCGDSGLVQTTFGINCFTFMMLATNIPAAEIAAAGMKPRHLARDLGLDVFCRENQEGLLEELNLRLNFGTNLNAQNLVITRAAGHADETKYKLSFVNGFAANWLSFCPNLINVSSRNIRQKVFEHGVYQTKIINGRVGDEINSLSLWVPRRSLFADAMAFPDGLLSGNRNSQLLWRILSVNFRGERGAGYGVLTNYYDEMSLQIFGQDSGLFDFVNQNTYVRLKKGLLANSRTLGTYDQVVAKLRAAGRFLGHVICANRRLSVDLSVMFLARLLGKIIGFEALHHYEPQIEQFYENAHNYGQDSGVPIPEAIPEAEQPDVWPQDQLARDNILDRAVSNFMTYDVEEEYREFAGGLFEIIPQSVFESGITTSDLNLLIFGNPDVDVDDMVANWRLLDYHPRSPVHRQTLEWLESIVREWDQIHRRKFVQFVTGTPTVPPGGFGTYATIGNRSPFTIAFFNFRVDHIPNAHNCYNQLDIGGFSTRARMKQLFEVGFAHGGGFDDL